MQIRQLKQENIPAVMDLLCEAFREDWYYARLFPDPATRREEMSRSFQPDVAFCRFARTRKGTTAAHL